MKSTREDALGFRLIGGFKLIGALLLGAAGFGIFRHLDADLGAVAQRFIARARLDPENRLVHGLLNQLAGVDRGRLKLIGAGTFFYATLELVEGLGLLNRRRWAGHLTIVATALLLIPEGFEIAHKVTAIRLAVLAVNLGILGYLILKLRSGRAGPTADP